MCGIFALLNNQTIASDIIESEFLKGKNRGPEFSKLDISYNNLSKTNLSIKSSNILCKMY